MLVLTRRPNESVRIDRKIVIRVLGVQNGRVRLGIEAPDEVVVLREEVAAQLGLVLDAPECHVLSEPS